MLQKTEKERVEENIEKDMPTIRKFLPRRSGRLRKSLQIKINTRGEVQISFNERICPYYIYVKNIELYIYRIEQWVSHIITNTLGILKASHIEYNIRDAERYDNEKQEYFKMRQWVGG